MKHVDRTLRIIGGNWRGRKVTFADDQDIRPTADRIRETLFNWLMHDITGARCLDLFAGSGGLALEALSRGAAHVSMVDSSRPAIDAIRGSLEQLGAAEDRFSLACSPAENWLKNNDGQFDIIFLDPPFHSTLLVDTCRLLAERNTAGGLVYIESGDAIDNDLLPPGWSIQQSKSAGAVNYALCNSG